MRGRRRFSYTYFKGSLVDLLRYNTGYSVDFRSQKYKKCRLRLLSVVLLGRPIEGLDLDLEGGWGKKVVSKRVKLA